jgi:cytoskeletal protein CcmA (bactofilin family)
MSNYTPTTNFAAKDSLPSGDPAKTIRGAEFSTEFNDLASSIASKANSANPIFSGTVTLDDLNVSGDTALGGTLGVTGGVDFSSTLDVTGATTLSSTLGVTGDTTVGGTLGVTGNTTLGGTLEVTGLLTADTIDGGTY